MRIWIDADACPRAVKEIVFRASDRLEIPVVLVTSLDDPAERVRGLEAGAEAYVVKQKFDQNELLRTIRQII